MICIFDPGWGEGQRFVGETAMAQYRLRFMDGLSGHVAVVRDFEAESDESALAEAESRRGAVAMELWCGDRKIRRWAPSGELTGAQ